MKKLTTIEEIKELDNKKVISVFSNFQQILNGRTEEEARSFCVDKPFRLWLHVPSYYLENGNGSIYDLGSGYIMIEDNQPFHRSINEIEVANGLAKPLPEFEATISIYKIV